MHGLLTSSYNLQTYAKLPHNFRNHSYPMQLQFLVSGQNKLKIKLKLDFLESSFTILCPITFYSFLGYLGSIPGRVIPKTQKVVLDASLLNNQHYKHRLRIKGKVGESKEGVAPSPIPWCSSYRKGILQATLPYGCQLYSLL